MSSSARVPDWEREEGRLTHGARPRAIAPSSQRMSSQVTMTCFFHQKIFDRSKCSWRRRQQYPSGIFFNDPLSDRTSSQCFPGGKPGQCTLGFLFYGYSSLCSSCIFLSTIACQYATYLLLFSGVLFVGPRAKPCVYSSFGPYGGRIPPLVLSTYSYDVCAHACWRFMIADIPLSCLRTGSVLLSWDGVLITPSQIH